MSKKEQNAPGKIDEDVQKSGKMKWIIAAFLALVMVSAAVGYVYVAASYRTRFLPKTTINGVDCSGMDAAEAARILTPSLDGYKLEVMGRDVYTAEGGVLLGTITAADVNMRYEGVQAAVEQALQEQNEYAWITAWLGGGTSLYFEKIESVYDKSRLRDHMQSWPVFQDQYMRAPEDACVSEYSATANAYSVVPEKAGTKINPDQAYSRIEEALDGGEARLDLDASGCYEEPKVRRDDEKLNAAVEAANTWLGTVVTYDWNGFQVVLDKELLRDWITVVGAEPVLDQEKVESFVKKQASLYDTYGKDRKFVTTHGVELTLPSGYYGWKTDTAAETAELAELIRQGGKTEREPLYSSEAKAKGMNDIGNSYVEADLIHQHLYLYMNGTLIFESDFVSGNMSNGSSTPPGVFGIAYRTTNVVLRGADYQVPVNYWMPYFNNYGMHDAPWRSEFGGDIYINEGSHGCINLPVDAAAQIFPYMITGFPVVCYYYDVDPLPQPEEKAQEPTDEEETDEEETD